MSSATRIELIQPRIGSPQGIAVAMRTYALEHTASGFVDIGVIVGTEAAAKESVEPVRNGLYGIISDHDDISLEGVNPHRIERGRWAVVATFLL